MWISLPSSGLRVTGADRVDFVHGQMTGDLRAAPTPGLVPCAFLNVRGQIEFFARVYRRADDLYLHLDAGQSEGLAARLRRYVIFDQVDLQEMDGTLQTVHVWPETALPGWQAGGPDAQEWELAGTRVLGGRVNRSGQPGVDLHFLGRDAAGVLALVWAECGQEAAPVELEAARIAAGIPDIARDHFQGLLPQEVGLDVGGPLPAISYRKGCYVGQEIMARLEARGNARHALAQVRGKGLPSFGQVFYGGKAVGQLGAVAGVGAGGLALARLRKEVPDGGEVEVRGESGGTSVAARVHWPAPVTT